MRDIFSSECTAHGQSRHLIYFHNFPWLHCMQSLIFPDGCDQDGRSMPQLCLLIGDYGVADNTCFSSTHCFIYILTGTINHVACFQCRRGFSQRVLSLREKLQIYVSGWTAQTFLFTGLSGTVLSQFPR